MSPDLPSRGVPGELSTASDRDWTVLSSLLMANHLTNRAMEAYLLRVYYDGSAQYDELAHLDELLETHREIVDQLELARSLVGERADGRDPTQNG